ncbi:FAD-binding domain-containing protein [Aspergillus karnatakaensis]|uniref:FAD-binding oxidoreductase n=1 Tax=Aspergillus karnatakaensis TaxID=1810916 RepID=UPI003CCCC62A
MRSSYTVSLFPLLGLAAAIVPGAVRVCEVLDARYPDLTVWDPLESYGATTPAEGVAFNNTLSEYWNRINGDIRPTCVFYPRNADQVSVAVKQLNRHPRVEFALKSGGHNFNVGFSATNGGVLISFNENLGSTVRSEDGDSFHVGPGARWGDVYTETSKTNQVVVGGRLGNIGVAGFTLGGGLSYYSAQYGLACDNVINFEVVLGDGKIVNANSSSNADLWWALKGGGNRFGIVTKFTLKAHSLGDNGRVWGGIRAYGTDQRTQLFSALSDLIETYPDPKAAVIPTFNVGPQVNILLFFYYDGASPPANAFAGLEQIPALLDTTAETTYTNLTSFGGGAQPTGDATAAHVNTFPNLGNIKSTELLEYTWQTYQKNLVATNDSAISFTTATFATQPIPRVIAEHGIANGGNTLGLDPRHGDFLWVENTILWPRPVCDKACPSVLREIGDAVEEKFETTWAGTKPTNYKSGNLDFISKNPLFMNDAANYQDVYSSYGRSNKAKLQRIARKYDRRGFLDRQGGWPL